MKQEHYQTKRYKKILTVLISIILVVGSVLAVSNSNKVKLTMKFILNNYEEECYEYGYCFVGYYNNTYCVSENDNGIWMYPTYQQNKTCLKYRLVRNA